MLVFTSCYSIAFGDLQAGHLLAPQEEQEAASLGGLPLQGPLSNLASQASEVPQSPLRRSEPGTLRPSEVGTTRTSERSELPAPETPVAKRRWVSVFEVHVLQFEGPLTPCSLLGCTSHACIQRQVWLTCFGGSATFALWSQL